MTLKSARRGGAFHLTTATWLSMTARAIPAGREGGGCSRPKSDNADKRQDKQDNYYGTDEVNDVVHDFTAPLILGCETDR